MKVLKNIWISLSIAWKSFAKVFSNIKIGIERRWKKFFVSFISAYSFLWVLVEPILGIGISADFKGNKYYFLILLILSLICTLYLVYPKSKITLSIPGTNCNINILYGDLFSQSGFIAIPTSQFFDANDLVSDKSLVAILRKEFFSDDHTILKNAIETNLANIEPIQSDRGLGLENKYPIGTIAEISGSNNSFLLFALTKSEIKSHQLDNNSNVANLWVCLIEFWKTFKSTYRGETISTPLIGSGVSGINLPPLRILETNLFAIIESNSQLNFITNEIDIILHDKYFDKIDLRELKEHWDLTNYS